MMVLATLVTDRIGTLSRMAALLGRLGMDILSVAVSPTPEEDVKRITLAVDGPVDGERLEREFLALTDVLEVQVLPPEERVDRELVLVKVRLSQGKLPPAVASLGGRVVWQQGELAMVEATGEPGHFAHLLGAQARAQGVVEAVVAGRATLSTFPQALPIPPHVPWEDTWKAAAGGDPPLAQQMASAGTEGGGREHGA
jgi:acetolactate synthase-1/3 small subunit